MWVQSTITQTWTAFSILEPFANSAAIDEAKVQPVPCVLRVFMRCPRSSTNSLPNDVGQSLYQAAKRAGARCNNVVWKDNHRTHTVIEYVNSFWRIWHVPTFHKYISANYTSFTLLTENLKLPWIDHLQPGSKAALAKPTINGWWNNLCTNDRILAAYTVWNVWKERNGRIFQQRASSALETTNNIRESISLLKEAWEM